MLVTSASTVIACQETKKNSDDNNQKPDPNPGEGGNEGGNTEEPTPDPEPGEKIELSVALPNKALNFIHIEDAEKPASSLPPGDDEEITDPTEKAFVNISRAIVKQLMEINPNKTAVNPFELYVHLPTLINDFGDMKTIVEVYSTSKTHQGQIEVTFSVDIHLRYFVEYLEIDLGDHYREAAGEFEIIEEIPEILDSYLFANVLENNPILNEARFKGRMKRKTPKVEWNKEKMEGSIEVVVEGYQGSIVVTYRAYPEITEYIRNKNLGGVVVHEGEHDDAWYIEEIMNRLYEHNREWMAEIDRQRVTIAHHPILGTARIWIEGTYGEVVVSFGRWFYPTETNVVTDLGEIRPNREGKITPDILHQAWRYKNLYLDPDFIASLSDITEIGENSAILKGTYQEKEWTYTLTYKLKIRN